MLDTDDSDEDDSDEMLLIDDSLESEEPELKEL